jgi:hypothetical protein
MLMPFAVLISESLFTVFCLFSSQGFSLMWCLDLTLWIRIW